MKKFTNFILPSLCVAMMTSFSVKASNDADLLDSKPVSYFPTEECYASEVIYFEQGLMTNGNPIGADRSDPSLALYQPDASNAAGGFVSLGVNGYIILGFDGVVYDAPGDDFMIYETSFNGDNCAGSNTESALIELSQDGSTWVTYGEICLDEAIDFSGLGLDYVTQIKIRNTASSPDGYDVDGVIAINGCQELMEECYPSNVQTAALGLNKYGNPITNPERNNPNKALGQPEDNDTENFVSLGYGGEIVVSFDGVVMNGPGNDITVFETTFGNHTFANYPESADVYVSQDGINFYLVGSAYTNEAAMFDIDNALTQTPLEYITQVKLIDTTPSGSVSDDGFDLDGIIAITGCSEAPIVDNNTCLDYKLFYSNNSITGQSSTDIYTINLSSGDAVLTPFVTRDYKSHLAYDGANNILYTVENEGSFLEKIDGTTGASLGFIPLSGLGSSISCNVFFEGSIYLASGSQGRIVEVNPATGTYVDIITDVPVLGGDLVVKDSQLYLATKTGNKLYQISFGTATVVGNIPANVNGLALTDTNDILFANEGATHFKIIDLTGSVNHTYPAKLNGETFTLSHGDLAGGCAQGEVIPECNSEIVNGGFEIDNDFPGTYSFVPQENVPGWSTTSASGTIEIQENLGTGDVIPSNSGDYHFELNGDGLNTLYQEICSTPGTNLALTFSHKKRRAGGIDKLELYIGGDLATIESNTAIPYVANVDMEWHANTFVFTVPEGQTSTFIYFKAISGTDNTVGNLLDDISISETIEAATNVEALFASLSTQEQSFELSNISMYPVPANDRITVNLNSQVSGKVSYEIVSLMGQSLNRRSLEANSGTSELKMDISNLADGTYFMKITMNGYTTTKQFIKVSK